MRGSAGVPAMQKKTSRTPTFISPQVPILFLRPSGSGWIHEIKHDGFRTLIRIVGKDVRAFTRNGYDWSDKYAHVINSCHKLACRSALIDGEIIVQDKNGVSDFAALRAAIDREPHRLVMFTFDLLFLEGADLRREPLWHRREKLRQLIQHDRRSALHFNDHYEGEWCRVVQAGLRPELGGHRLKAGTESYKSGPSKFWLKTKNVAESELTLPGTDYDNEGKPIAYLGRSEVHGIFAPHQ